MDYCLPRAANFSAFNLATHAPLCAHNPAGRQGAAARSVLSAHPQR
jgi:hypothetical protein